MAIPVGVVNSPSSGPIITGIQNLRAISVTAGTGTGKVP